MDSFFFPCKEWNDNQQRSKVAGLSLFLSLLRFTAGGKNNINDDDDDDGDVDAV